MLTISRAGGSSKQRRQPISVTPAPDVSSSTPAKKASSQPPQQQQQQQQQVSLQTSTEAPADAGAAAAAVAQPDLFKVVSRKVLKELASLPRAIGIMAVITGLSALGTIIPQNKGLEYYLSNYPTEGDKVLGFLDYQLLLLLQLDHIYSAWYFYAAIGLLGASLMACTYTTQLPTAKVAQRWRFASTPLALRKQGTPQVLPSARLSDVASQLAAKSYQVFLQDGQLYAFKGLAGRLGPIGVHIALLMCLAGTAWSGFGTWKGTAMCPEGQEFVVGQALRPASSLASYPAGADTVLQVNKFTIDTRPDGSVAQFYSDLTLRDFYGKELLTKRISVNDPFRYNGVTMYQTDWSLAALTLRLVEPGTTAAVQSGSEAGSTAVQNTGQVLQQLQSEAQQQQQQQQLAAGSSKAGLPQRSFNLPLASLEGRPGVPMGTKLYATFLPLELPPEDGRPPRGISILARDLDTVTFYDSKGQFAGVRRAGSGKPIEVEGLGIVLEDIVGSTGLEIKNDPGVPLVYAGFGALMITTLISYVSHSQVWALQQGSDVVVVGKSNRAKVLFAKELDSALDTVPEVQQ
ncbi:hypothetical protein OEZ86_012602 [Tetradesmus obliquus]|nr:hypothetical protein OEZ86_012602 [Tetradesmus obliquus]